jgi:RNA polymerase sigma-70 factor (ECF subfamily)
VSTQAGKRCHSENEPRLDGLLWRVSAAQEFGYIEVGRFLCNVSATPNVGERSYTARGAMESDEELMERYKGGDRAAITELVRRYAPLLLRVMLHQVRAREDAYDLVQQTFLQLHRSKGDFRPGGQLRPWLLTIAVNVRHRHFRRMGVREALPLEPYALERSHFGLAGTDAAEAGCDVRTVLAGLPPDQRDVIVLHWIEGFSFPEVALVVGASLAAVKVRAHRGYVAIRKILAEDAMDAEPAPSSRG